MMAIVGPITLNKFVLCFMLTPPLQGGSVGWWAEVGVGCLPTPGTEVITDNTIRLTSALGALTADE